MKLLRYTEEKKDERMKKMTDIYRRIIKEILGDREQVLYVFQGFPFYVYEALLQSGIPHLREKEFSEYIDYNSLEGKEESVNLLMRLMTSTETAWIFYEEFIAISGKINDFSLYSGKIVVVRNNLFENYFPIPVRGQDETEKILRLYAKEGNEDHPIFKYYSDCKLIDGVMYYAYVNKHYEVDTGIKIEERDFYRTGSEMMKGNDSCEKISLSSLRGLKNQLQSGQIRDARYIVTEHSSTLYNELKIINRLGEFLKVEVYAERNEKKHINDGKEFLPILKKHWGEQAEFRKNLFYKEPEVSSATIEISQGEIIADIIRQCVRGVEEQEFSDLIVTAPTGAGKSLFFQIPGIYLYQRYQSVTIVICPLVALMVDQVKELHEKGVRYATFINSSITFEERKERLEGIKSGKYSILYLSPELLLSMDMRSLVGARKVGLIVVDEAHLVTSWGRDFRVDYWFLGDYLEKARHGSYYSKDEKVNVPILCLTATAVFGGQDDVIGDLQNSLQLVCNSEQLYLGYVRRDNIEFIIRRPVRKGRSDKEEKVRLTVKELERSAEEARKTIVYFPFRSSVEDIWNRLKDGQSCALDRTVRYHSGESIGGIEKDQAYREFRDNEKTLMLATKAFGMGVNISDIEEVYHYAPTGTLADYIQEIGRAARKLEHGYAVTDYLPTDMHYARTLWGLSGLRHYQIQEMMKKLYEIYENKKKRNLLVSPDTFNYLFDSQSVEGKVKSGLMLMANDLLETYHFKVIAVRAKSLFSRQYITVPAEIEDRFMGQYRRYCREMKDVKARKEYNREGYSSLTFKNGKVYEVDLAALWEKHFSDKTFPKFKWDFFHKKLFDFGEVNIVPNSRLTIRYTQEYEKVKLSFYKLAKTIQKVFLQLKRGFGGRNFMMKDFSERFLALYGEPVRKEYIAMLLDLFCYDHVDLMEYPKENWKFIERRKADDSGGFASAFCIRTQKYSFIETNLKRYFNLAEPNSGENIYITYIPIVEGDTVKVAHLQLLASILQLFGMAAYEMNGGMNPEIFIRINDSQKLKRIAFSDKRYTNRLLTQIEQRHKRAVSLMNQFMKGDFTNEQRWEIIEEYFLGHDDYVGDMLGEGINRSANS